MMLDCAGKKLDLGLPRVMGILNVTPDSFSDGGDFFRLDAARRRAEAMALEGAAIIDIGGESTRPGAVAVGIQEEMDRVLPVVEALANDLDIPLSIDTSKPELMKAAVSAGAGMINDVMALRAPGAVTVALESNVPICLMHMQGEPRVMQRDVSYQDVTSEVLAFLRDRVQQCTEAGIKRSNLILDPGFGFGKHLKHNIQLFRDLSLFAEQGMSLLVGVSRKSMLGAITGRDVVERMPGSIALSVLAADQGVNLVRVHDVRETVDALKVWASVRVT